MQLIKFIGYTGVLLLLESMVLALTASLVILVVKIAAKTGLAENSTEKILHWLVLGTKIITIWFAASLLVLGAKYYAAENSIYFWVSILIGGLLLWIFKIDAIRLSQKNAYDAAMHRWKNSDLAMAEVRISSMPKLWKQESALNFVAFVYVLITALFNSLVEITWLETALKGVLWIFTIQKFLSITLYLVGWLFVGRYLFVICVGLRTLPWAISNKN